MELLTHVSLLKVICFAAEKHRYQHRKDGMTPYINHPIEVAKLLIEYGETDLVLLSAALLHDTIEDTNATKDDILKLFGEDVLKVVLEVTDEKNLSRPERKKLQVEHAATLSRKGKLLKLADKICNISDLMSCPPEGWTDDRKIQYFKWSRQVVDQLRGVNPELEKHFDNKIRQGSMLFGNSLTLNTDPFEID